ncbi:MAG TPA: hypothetical protein VFO38_05800 [Candidatus Saccharimonadales bacterium]|nr:hypothetical protein [Candidatus Saccharimonadales bacterium]
MCEARRIMVTPTGIVQDTPAPQPQAQGTDAHPPTDQQVLLAADKLAGIELLVSNCVGGVDSTTGAKVLQPLEGADIGLTVLVAANAEAPDGIDVEFFRIEPLAADPRLQYLAYDPYDEVWFLTCGGSLCTSTSESELVGAPA